jgi:hypothetical protein
VAEHTRAEYRLVRLPIGLSVGVVLFVVGASLTAVKEIARTFSEPTWLTVYLIALGVVSVAGDKVIDTRRRAHAERAEAAREEEKRKRTITALVASGRPFRASRRSVLRRSASSASGIPRSRSALPKDAAIERQPRR